MFSIWSTGTVIFSGRSRISLRWERQLSGSRQHTILTNFTENCMKLKEFGCLRASIPAPHIRSANDIPHKKRMAWYQKLSIDVYHYQNTLKKHQSGLSKMSQNQKILTVFHNCGMYEINIFNWMQKSRRGVTKITLNYINGFFQFSIRITVIFTDMSGQFWKML